MRGMVQVSNRDRKADVSRPLRPVIQNQIRPVADRCGPPTLIIINIDQDTASRFTGNPEPPGENLSGFGCAFSKRRSHNMWPSKSRGGSIRSGGPPIWHSATRFKKAD